MSKLAKKLRRELKNNPKKGITLGLLLVIAGYFWAPLVMGWFGNDADRAAAPAAASGAAAPGATVVQPPTAAPSASPASPALPAYTWQQLAGWIDEDARMRPAVSVSPRDPFQPPASVLKKN